MNLLSLQNLASGLLILISSGVGLSALPASAELTLPHIFGDNMVLQRDMPIPVWGRAAPGEQVTVSLADETRETKAGSSGQWKVVLPSLNKKGPLELSVKAASGSEKVFKNVLLGEVWVCAGQSNMEKPIGPHPGQRPCINYPKEIAAANYPEIRLMEVPPTHAKQPATDANCRWLPCSPQTIVIKRGGGHGFSACAYFFGRELHRELKVPIGLVAASAGGTRCEPWTPGQGRNGQEAVLYNGMIAPLMPMAIRGAIWYQGESNNGDGMKYCAKMKTLITGWRNAWGQGDFPFYFVQLPDFPCGPNNLAEMREAQTATLALPNTGMAVTIDIGTFPDCHCTNKQEVGRRLALWALAKDYGRKDLVYSGPLYQSMEVEGDKIRIHFNPTGSGLTTRDGSKELTFFEIAAADGKFVPAKAMIDNDSVLVFSDAVKQPIAARFAWDERAIPNLVNKELLPATTFRTNPPGK
ncbi:MAG: sialate O-acetylesterase [Planctomycetota bacterium]